MEAMVFSGVIILVLIALLVFPIIRGSDWIHITAPLVIVVSGGLWYLRAIHGTPPAEVARAAPATAGSRCPAGVLRDRMVVAQMHQLHVPELDALHAARTLVMRCPGSAVMWFELAIVRLAYGLPNQSRVALAMAYRLDPSGEFAPKSEITRIQQQAFIATVENWYFLAFLAVMLVAALVLWALNVKYGRKRVRAALLGEHSGDSVPSERGRG